MLWMLFGKILAMSLTGAWCVLIVLLIRLLLHRCERKYSYYLWLVVFCNLIIPFSFHGSFSLIPSGITAASTRMAEEAAAGASAGRPQTDFTRAGSGSGRIEDYIRADAEDGFGIAAEGSAEKAGIEEDRLQQELSQALWRILGIAPFVWLLGIFAIMAYELACVLKVKSQTSNEKWTGWNAKRRIARVKGLPAPFLWGIFRPVIYVPEGLEKEELRYIVAHENCHRRRKDSVLKPVVFFVTALHRFNPLVWIAYALFCRDMEMSCDEAVLTQCGKDIRASYARSLLTYAARQNGYRIAPLTFGEPSVKSRIKNVLRTKKRSLLLSAFAIICVAAVVVGLTVRPEGKERTENDAEAGNDLRTEMDAETEIDTETEMKADPYSVLNEEAVEPEESVEEVSESKEQWEITHRPGFTEPSLTRVETEWSRFTMDREKAEELAQRALRDLYDLTGWQVTECTYSYNSETGDFNFANTADDMKHDRVFYGRCFGEEAEFDVISSMYLTSRRRVWYSEVDQMELPENVDQMRNGELAVWFLQHSSLYQGEQIVKTEPVFESDPELIRVLMENGTSYEVDLDRKINSVESIYGPYPAGFSH